VNSRIVSFDDQEVLGTKQYVVFSDNLSFQRGAGDAEPFGRRTHDGAGLQQDDPVVLDGVIRRDRDQVTRHFSSENAHGDPRSASCDRDESTKVYGEVNQPSMVWVTELGRAEL
jgi:hypothetical protein